MQNLASDSGKSKANMPWFRMYHEFATDPKVQMLPEADQRRYVMILCLRCCNGDVTVRDDEVAFQLRITEGEWADTKARLLAKGLIDENNHPSAWDRRQFVSDSSNERVSRHRERKKASQKQPCNVTVTAPEADTDTEADTEKDSERTVIAASIPDAARERLAGLNGSLDLIWSDVIAWGVDPGQAVDYLANVLDANGPDVVRDAHAKLKADLILGADIRSPAAVLPHVARRMRAGYSAGTAMKSKTAIMVEAIRTMGAA